MTRAAWSIPGITEFEADKSEKLTTSSRKSSKLDEFDRRSNKLILRTVFALQKLPSPCVSHVSYLL